jgi:hypothetical protein
LIKAAIFFFMLAKSANGGQAAINDGIAILKFSLA